MARHPGCSLSPAGTRPAFSEAVRIGRLLVEKKGEILSRWRTAVRDKLGGGALDRVALEDGWGRFLDAIGGLLQRAGGGDDPLVGLDGSAHGAQRLHLGFDATEIVRETGILHGIIVEIAEERGYAFDAQEQRLLLRCFYTALATAVGEHARRRDAEVERETVDQLGRLAVDNDGSARGVVLRQLHAWAESRSASPVASAERERFSLASVLASAVAAVRDEASEREVPVLVDLATPIEIDGAPDLLLRAIVRVLGSAIGATRRGGSVVARAQILSGGRVRIDIRDECGGRSIAPAGHFLRPVLALGHPRAAGDWSIVRRAIAANRGTVHARKLPGVGCLVTIDVPGRGDEDPCCGNEPAIASAVSPPRTAPTVGLRDRAGAVAEQLRRVVEQGLLEDAPRELRARVMLSVGELATRAGVDEVTIARAERALIDLYRKVTARTRSSCVSTLSKRC